MQEPAIPENEESRLKALRELNVLDTDFENRFDRLTRMAARLFDVPIALVSLVDSDRQWFKSKFGLEARETPRDISFCGHTIIDKEVLIVNNANEDARFADNPLVTADPNIRFYAGCPIQMNADNRIGTLCIIDNQPREFPAEDVQILKDLAYMVEQELTALKISTEDELTQLSNRRGFMMLAQHAFKMSVRQTTPLTLVFFDLDDFKLINDNFGHDQGDRALTLFAEQLQNRFRASDIFARIGGDEFIVLLNNTTVIEAEKIIFDFKISLDKVVSEMDIDYSVNFSSGTIQYNAKQHNTLEDMIKEGDELMYQSKREKH
ncbi:MAG: diguanylate cyclase [Pseudomonadales bacterium]|nr:diguanylate cyclase [Pseudomonadales bacterium]